MEPASTKRAALPQPALLTTTRLIIFATNGSKCMLLIEVNYIQVTPPNFSSQSFLNFIR